LSESLPRLEGIETNIKYFNTQPTSESESLPRLEGIETHECSSTHNSHVRVRIIAPT